MKGWLRLAERIDALNKLMALVARWSVMLMLALGLWNVVGRYLGVSIGQNLSSNALIEAQWYVFDLMFLLGLGWTLQQQGHVRVDVLQSRWGPKRQARSELFGTLVFLLPFALAVMALSIEPALLSWSIGEISPDPDGLPRYWVKTLIPIGFMLLALQGVSQAIRTWAKLKTSPSTFEGRRQESSLD